VVVADEAEGAVREGVRDQGRKGWVSFYLSKIAQYISSTFCCENEWDMGVLWNFKTSQEHINVSKPLELLNSKVISLFCSLVIFVSINRAGIPC
jgi:hypothetical protein